jgi:hypothetical protein
MRNEIADSSGAGLDDLVGAADYRLGSIRSMKYYFDVAAPDCHAGAPPIDS